MHGSYRLNTHPRNHSNHYAMEESTPCIVNHTKHVQQGCVQNNNIMASSRLLYNDKTKKSTSSNKWKNSSCPQKCVLFTFILAILLLTVCILFFIIHWLSGTSLLKLTMGKSPDMKSLTSDEDDLIKMNKTFEPSLPNDITTNSTNTNDPFQNNMHHFSINKIYAPVSERSINDIPQEVAAQYNTPIIYSVTPQLNQTIIPMHYDINLDLTEVTSHNHVIGRMAIYLKTTTHDLKNQKEIKLHVSANVFLQRIRLRGGNQTITITAIKRQKQLKMLLLVLEEELIYSDYLLEMEFSTKICTKECEGVQCIMKNNEIVGFTTKFEPFFARTLLPCWDSPNFKSTFNVTIKHDPSKTVLSNGMIGHQTDILSRANKKHMQMTSFKKTPVMSVYLLAFVYGDFAKFESRSQRNVSISIYTEPSTQYLTHFAANFTPTMLDLLETEFRIKYPMEKIDFVATANLPVGGIENWGLVIFHNNMLLIENDRSNSPQMSVDHLYDTIKIEKIVTHELIHQWIGNLVSVNDWSEIWINEGFATFYVYKILRESHRAVMDQEYLTRLSDLIEQQCGEFKTSLIQEFTRDTLYSDLFQPIGVYVRGSVVVQMIQNLVGEDAFADGMITFLTRNSYRSVDRHTLWASMPPLSSWGKEKEILGSVMESWLVNKGIPEVTISRNYNDHSIRLTQQLSDLNKYAIFLNDNHPLKGPKARRVNRNIRVKAYNIERVGRGKIKVQNIEDNERMDIPKTSRSTNYDENKDVWSIPFSYQFHSLKSEKYKFTKQFWLHNETILFTDKDISSNVLLLANPDWLFPFKVNYDIQNWRMIIDMLHSNLSEIPTKSRIQLIIDSKTYIMHSGVPELYVQLLGYLHHETELCVLLFGIDAVYNLIDTYRGSSIGEQLVMYLQQVIQKFDTTLSKSDYDAEVAAVWLIDADRISKLYKLRCIAELESCESLKHRNQWLRQPTALDVEEYQQITGICSYLFNEAGYEEINLLMKFLEYRSQQWTVNVALSSCIKEEALLKHVVKKIIETKNAAVYMSVLESVYSIHYNLDFRKLFWQKIAQLPDSEKTILFAVNTGKSDTLARSFLHSIRSLEELNIAHTVLPVWSHSLEKNFEYLRRKLTWIQGSATARIVEFLKQTI